MEDHVCEDFANNTQQRDISIVSAMASITLYEQYGDNRVDPLHRNYLSDPDDIEQKKSEGSQTTSAVHPYFKKKKNPSEPGLFLNLIREEGLIKRGV